MTVVAEIVALTLKRPFIQLEVQVFNLATGVRFSNSANEVNQHLYLQRTVIDHN